MDFHSVPFHSSPQRHGLIITVWAPWENLFWAKQTERVCLFSLFRCSAKVSPPKRRLKHRNVNLFEAFQSNERSFYVENLARGKSTGFYVRYFTPFGYSNSRLYYSYLDVFRAICSIRFSILVNVRLSLRSFFRGQRDRDQRSRPTRNFTITKGIDFTELDARANFSYEDLSSSFGLGNFSAKLLRCSLS